MTSLTTISKPSDVKSLQEGIHLASISDLHLAHPRTNTVHIVARLYETFPDNEETAALDLILIAGDVFDHLLNLPQAEVDLIQEWISDLLDLCAKYDILIRVLEGTPSHDWGQSQQFLNINDSKKHPAKLKYVETLSIETIEELGGLTVLYVPDEWNAEANTTKLQVMELMRLHGLDKVDVACMHGSFDYQLPIESVKNHDSQWYMSIVRHYIVIGHIHIRSEKTVAGMSSFILAQGSLDRLSHGEEAPKGHYRMIISPKGNRHWFVENTKAKIYETVDCRDLGLEEILKKFREREHYPDASAIRLLLKRSEGAAGTLRELRKQYPQFKITTHLDSLGHPGNVLVGVKAERKFIKPITVTRSNVSHLVMAAIERDFPNLPDTEQENVQRVLERYI